MYFYKVKYQLNILNCIIVLCVFFSSEKSNAQLGFCNGNSGDPIFTEDFGTGTTNTALPTGTTTYTFVNGIPNDGEYTVTNSLAGNTFEWHPILDLTSGDTNGKMLVINADDNIAGEFYRTSVSGLCETTTYEFSAWLINLVIPGGFCSIQPGGEKPINVRFEIWDSTDTNLLASGSTGNIFGSSSPNWQEQALVFQTLPSQTSVILKMINNGTGGCGNDLAIDDIEFKTCGDFIEVEDSNSNNDITLCSGETPFSTTLTAIPDNTVFSSYFYQWQQSLDAVNWSDIAGETSVDISITGVTNTNYFRAKVAESAANVNSASCNTFSEIFPIIVTQAGNPPDLECWETATLNNTTCTWEVSGSQPEAPTDLECWEIATFNNTSCSWEISGTQPNPPILECWETTVFNETTCSWDVTGTQPEAPTDLECWETAIFNNLSCAWEVTGTQPAEPTGLECWEVTNFNTTTCSWEVSGTQPNPPTLECWETATFNSTSCSWEVSGTQPAEPTGLDCWESTTFNTTSCAWEISGTQPDPPTDLECWETTSFNTTSCTWEVSGTQPQEPTNLECWEVATFNQTLCLWEVTGTQPQEPTDLECWQIATFNNTTCVWDIEGEEPISFIEETVTFCEDDDVILSGNVGLSNPEYSWSNGAMTESITVEDAGTYTVEVTSNNCITIIKTFTVIENTIPIIDSVVSDGNNIVVVMANSGDFEYSLDGVFYQLGNIFFNTEGGFYTIFVRERNGCGLVTLEHLHFIIPKYFTPNGDGIKDIFNLRGIEFFDSSEVYIFDRFGKLLKGSRNQPFFWDGTYNGELMPTSDYWYVIRINNQEIKGHFTLKR